jgi:hypothetical protein
MPGEQAEFAVQILKPPASRLTIRTRLLRDGFQVYEGPATPLEPGGLKAGHFFARSVVEIPSGTEPGEYLLRRCGRSAPAAPSRQGLAVGAPQQLLRVE